MQAYPLSKEKIATLVTNLSHNSVKSFVASCGFVELCAICVLSRFYRSESFTIHGIEKCLAEFYKEAKQVTFDEMREYVINFTSTSSMQKALETLADLNLPLMSQAEIDEHNFLTSAGNWKITSPEYESGDLVEAEFFNTPNNYSRQFTPDQLRIVQVYLADSRESLDVQGFAGTGKTHVIATIIQSLPKESLLISAQTHFQLQSLKSKLGNQYQYLTFGDLANFILSSNLINRHNFAQFRTDLSYNLSNTELFRKLNMLQVGNMTPEWTAFYVHSTLRSFCHRPEASVQDVHVPQHIKLSKSDRSVIASIAERMWLQTIEPLPGDKSPLPLRSYHSIKNLSLTGDAIPKKFETIVIDEAHDLSIPMIQIIDRSSQSILTFGDDYQTFGRSIAKHRRRSKSVRHKEMSYSFRAGKGANKLYNEILNTHPVKTEEPFQGAKSINTDVSPYDHFNIPDKATAFLSTDLWNTFDVLQYLVNAKANYHILTTTRLQLKPLISECIELYLGKTRTTRHYLLKNVRSWSEFREQHQNPIFDRYEALLKSGFTHEDWATICENSKGSTQNHYVVGLIEHAKNQEFDRVMLLSDTLYLPHSKTKEVSKTVNQIYTGISRAKYSISIPSDLTGWLQDIRSRNQ